MRTRNSRPNLNPKTRYTKDYCKTFSDATRMLSRGVCRGVSSACGRLPGRQCVGHSCGRAQEVEGPAREFAQGLSGRRQSGNTGESEEE